MNHDRTTPDISYMVLGKFAYRNNLEIGRINPTLKFRLRTSRQTGKFVEKGFQGLHA